VSIGVKTAYVLRVFIYTCNVSLLMCYNSQTKRRLSIS